MFHPEIITEIINLISTKEKNDLIFSYSKKDYDLHQFNVGSLYPKDVKKMNQSLKRRYKHQQIQILPTNWNQGERRLFVWFIICFLYEKRIKIEDITEEDLKSLSQIFYGKDTIFLDFQLRNLPKVTKTKRTWTSEEDELLKKAIKTLKGDVEDSKVFNNWNDVAKIIFFQTQRRIFRTPKSCRQRWYNHLDESKKKDQFSLEQDLILINYIIKESKSWSKIVKVMNYSRTEHRIKNRYYTLIRKYQRSAGGSQTDELTQQEEREVVLKLKAILEAEKDRSIGPDQIEEERGNETFRGVKIQEGVQRVGQNVEEQGKKFIQHSNSSSQNLKIKIETDHLSAESVIKVKILQEQEFLMNRLGSSDEFKQSPNSFHLQSQDFKATPMPTSYWPQTPMQYPQYGYYMNMVPEPDIEPQQVLSTPIIFNQFYCPIYYQNGMGYQYYQQ